MLPKSLVLLNLLILIGPSRSDHDGSSDPLDWLREGVPGEPGVDYPIYDTVPETSFKCEDQATGGYYADEEARCQVSAFALYGS